MWSFLQGLIVMMCACAVLGQRIDQEEMMSPRTARVRDRNMAKTDEPSCDQLKAMWRFSKRQARAPEIMNEMSSYRDPLMYNEWPLYTSMPRPAPRFRYQYHSMPHGAYGRVLTKAPPNVVRTPDYDEMFGILNRPHTSGKILRYPGPSRLRGVPTSFMVPPQRDRFETLKKIVRHENLQELQRKYETEHKHELKAITSGRGDDYGKVYGNYGEQELRGLQQLEYADDAANKQQLFRKPQGGSRQMSQFSRYSDVMLPSRRTFLYPYFDYAVPHLPPYF